MMILHRRLSKWPNQTLAYNGFPTCNTHKKEYPEGYSKVSKTYTVSP